MKPILKIALAAAMTLTSSAPAWAAEPQAAPEWYAGGVGTQDSRPAPRAGHTWSPSRYEWTGTQHVAMPGTWIVDDYDRQWRAYADGTAVVLDSAPVELRDRDDSYKLNVAPSSPRETR